MENFKKKFAYNDPDLRDFFVKNGYVIIKNLIDRKIIDKLSTYCWSRIKKLKKLSKKKKYQRNMSYGQLLSFLP